MFPSPCPLLSVIIPTLNEAEHLPGLLADLRKQQGVDLEIIVGDGGSVDATWTVAEEYGACFVCAPRGRGAQMNVAVKRASGDYYLFLHADSRIDDPALLAAALGAVISEPGAEPVAGHFRLSFMRTVERNTMAYRFAEEKSAFNRAGTTNGDQGLLLAKTFFDQLGGFDESLPFLEDQRLAEKIRACGRLVTLPGCLKTSARRFEAEGFHRRYILMSMMMGLHNSGVEEFFVRAPGVYRVQQDTGRLLLTPFFMIIWQMMRDQWGVAGTVRVFYRLGRYVKENSWQAFYFCDVCCRSLLGSGRYPFLKLHDSVIAPLIQLRVFNATAGAVCFIWFMGILFPLYWCLDRIVRQPQK